MNREFNPLVFLRIIPVIITLGGVALSLACLPLIQGNVAPNHSYGIRTPLAFSSEENWYKVNRLGGWLLLGAGAFVSAVGATGFVMPARGLIIYVCVAVALAVAAIVGSAAWIISWT